MTYTVLSRAEIGEREDSDSKLPDYWHDLTLKEKRIIIEQICDKIIIGNRA